MLWSMCGLHPLTDGFTVTEERCCSIEEHPNKGVVARARRMSRVEEGNVAAKNAAVDKGVAPNGDGTVPTTHQVCCR